MLEKPWLSFLVSLITPSSPFWLFTKSDRFFSSEDISISNLFVSSSVAILVFSFLILAIIWDSTSLIAFIPSGIIESKTQRTKYWSFSKISDTVFTLLLNAKRTADRRLPRLLITKSSTLSFSTLDILRL